MEGGVAVRACDEESGDPRSGLAIRKPPNDCDRLRSPSMATRPKARDYDFGHLAACLGDDGSRLEIGQLPGVGGLDSGCKHDKDRSCNCRQVELQQCSLNSRYKGVLSDNA